MAWQVDTFTVPWYHLDFYTLPLSAILRLVLNLVLMSNQVRMTLIAPICPQQGWFPLFQQIEDFLIHLRREKLLLTSAFKDYHSAL